MDVARPGPRVVPATLTTSAPTLLPLRVPELPARFHNCRAFDTARMGERGEERGLGDAKGIRRVKYGCFALDIDEEGESI